MSEKRFRTECVGHITPYFIVDDFSAKKRGKNTSYKAYETGKKKKTDELVDLLNSLYDENEQLKKKLYETERDYLIETSDISDKPYLEEELLKLKKEYGVFDDG